MRRKEKEVIDKADIEAFPGWLTKWMKSKNLVLWGAAGLRDFSTPPDKTGKNFFRLNTGQPGT
ncbi:MAG: hypothetical protein R6W95_00500 [Desulfosarcina sp.]